MMISVFSEHGFINCDANFGQLMSPLIFQHKHIEVSRMSTLSTLNNINNNLTTDSSVHEFGSTAPILSSFEFLNLDNDLENKMLSSGDLVINQMLDDLILERMDWETNEFYRSNERLYALLTRCYGFFQSLKGTSNEARLARKSFARFIKVKGLKIPDTTHLMTKVIWTVFGGKTRQASKYSSALRVAADMKVKTNELKDFFIAFGGIDEVIRAKNDEMPRHEKGRAVLYGETISTIQDDFLSKKINVNNYEDSVLLLATYDDENKNINVLRVIQNKAAIKASFASLSSSVTNNELNALLEAEYEDDA